MAVAAYEKALELSPSTAKHQADLDQARQKLKEHEAREAAKVRQCAPILMVTAPIMPVIMVVMVIWVMTRLRCLSGGWGLRRWRSRCSC